MTSFGDVNLLQRENARLLHQTRKLQEMVGTLKEEVADANAEIAASQRLFDEQKKVMLHELQRERAWRERLQREVVHKSMSSVSVGTNTLSDVSTSTVIDAETMTLPVTIYSYAGEKIHEPAGAFLADGPRSSSSYPPHSHPRQIGAPPYGFYDNPGAAAAAADMMVGNTNVGMAHTTPVSSRALYSPVGGSTTPSSRAYSSQYQGGGEGGKRNSNYSRGAPNSTTPPQYGDIRKFAEHLGRSAQYHNQDLYNIFTDGMGATSVGEICATVSEKDLIDFGIPLVKARHLMHLIMEHTAKLLHPIRQGGRR